LYYRHNAHHVHNLMYKDVHKLSFHRVDGSSIFIFKLNIIHYDIFFYKFGEDIVFYHKYFRKIDENTSLNSFHKSIIRARCNYNHFILNGINFNMDDHTLIILSIFVDTLVFIFLFTINIYFFIGHKNICK
jgi:hypothetical protein